jgi:hypothetical protein
MLSHLQSKDGDIVIDTGAGRGIKPTMHGLTNPTTSTSRIKWGDGSLSNTTVEASLPNHELPPFLVTPKASSTLVSIGSNTEGKDHCYSFFDRHGFRVDGLQIFKNKQGNLGARFVGPEENRVKYICSKSHAGGVYNAPSLEVFKPNEDGSWRFTHANANGDTIIAGPTSSCTPCIQANIATTVNTIFAGFSERQRKSLCESLQRPDYVDACEYTVADLNANQQRLTQRLIRKHNQYGHIP